MKLEKWLYVVTEGDGVELPEASEDDVYGRYLFAPERRHAGDLRVPMERNTREEEDVLDDLRRHYSGVMEKFAPHVLKLARLRDEGKYLRVLQVPSEYRDAYRIVSLRRFELLKLLGVEDVSTSHGKMRLGVVGMKGGRQHSSWTVDKSVLRDILEDWGGFSWSANGRKEEESIYLVLMRASIVGNNFLMNPDVMGELEDVVGSYGYQREVLSVGDIRDVEVGWVEVEGSAGGRGFDLSADRDALKVLDSLIG